MSNTYLMGVACVGLLLAGLLFFAFARPVQSHTATGAIVDKAFEDEQTIVRSNVGPRRELWTQNRIRIPAGYIFQIRLDGGGDVYHILERVSAEPFHVGQRVTVTYDERGLPPFWTKRYVRSIAPVPTTP